VVAEAGDPAQFQLRRLAVRRGLDGGDKRRLAGRATAALAARALTAEVGVVQFNPPAELVRFVGGQIRRLTFRCGERPRRRGGDQSGKHHAHWSRQASLARAPRRTASF
jgi:hypothetical protein